MILFDCPYFDIHPGSDYRAVRGDCVKVSGSQGERCYVDRNGPRNVESYGQDLVMEFFANKRGTKPGFKCNYRRIPGEISCMLFNFECHIQKH